MRSSYIAAAAIVWASCLALVALARTSSDLDDDDDDDDDNFELEAIPLEDAYDLLTTIEKRTCNPAVEDNRTFGVIVDCGSSGTRAHLYEWDGALSYPQLLHYIEPMRGPDRRPLSRKFSPSLSSFADDPPEKLEEYIKRVLDYIESYIPRKSHPFTGVYILATAGMRLLDDETQARIMSQISAYIEREYNFAKVKTSVISGAHEGMYQWISVNAKARRFLGQNTSWRTKTFAVIEMGGASVQVTYQLRPGVSEVVSSLLPDEQVRQVYRAQIVEPQLSRHDSPENTYLLHSTTFLGFGSNSAREAYLDLLLHRHLTDSGWHKFVDWSKRMLRSCFDPLQDQKEDAGDLPQGANMNNKLTSKLTSKNKNKSGNFNFMRKNKNKNKNNNNNNNNDKSQDETSAQLVLDDPCSPKGFQSETLKKPKRLLENTDTRILGYLLDEDEPYFVFKVRGTGSYGKCKRLVEDMLKLSRREKLNCKPDEQRHCTMSLIGQNFIPFDSIDFLGIGDIYYTTNLMLRAAGTYDHHKVTKRTRTVCNTPYESLKTQFAYLHEDPKLKSRITDECFKAVWVDTFLVKGLNMPTHLSTLKTVGQINNDALEWTLGAVLDKSLAIEEAAEENAEEIFGPENSRNQGESKRHHNKSDSETQAETETETGTEDHELDLGPEY